MEGGLEEGSEKRKVGGGEEPKVKLIMRGKERGRGLKGREERTIRVAMRF